MRSTAKLCPSCDDAHGSIFVINLRLNLQFRHDFGRDNDIVIPWEDIEIIGAETILVKSEMLDFLRSISFDSTFPLGRYWERGFLSCNVK